jgi:hypothetical protein
MLAAASPKRRSSPECAMICARTARIQTGLMRSNILVIALHQKHHQQTADGPLQFEQSSRKLPHESASYYHALNPLVELQSKVMATVESTKNSCAA